MAGGKVKRRVRSKTLRNHTVLVTAGPTVEDIDPVRFISNRSSGRMGVCIASEAAKRGARVLLIHGPLQVRLPCNVNIKSIAVRSARDMYRAVMENVGGADMAILCAAVADFAPSKKAARKLKKDKKSVLRLELIRTPDILAALGARKRRPVLVGFAAETDNETRYATKKLLDKNCDMICANNVLRKGSGFGSLTNRITLFRRDGKPKRLPLLTKAGAAARILDEIERMRPATRPAGSGP